ncbi:sensor histidine kinase [Azospirillum sp. A39]|uniref:sensor histidine kinase n=1 Tax=Azospirillum sp. A39 TaxID=3462279 RepID=UPI0040456BF5
MVAWSMALPLRRSERRARWLWRSLASRLALLTVVFLAVPVLIYDQLERADDANRALLLHSAQQRGTLIARALEPQLSNADRASLPQVGDLLGRFAGDGLRLRLLVRPAAIGGDDGFFYVGAAPAVSTAYLDTERRQLQEQGALEQLSQTCAGGFPMATRVPRSSGAPEVVTSVIPIHTRFGCWALVTSHNTEAYIGSSLGQPYWRTASVQAAALIYVVMAVLVLAVFLEVWRNLHRFRALARDIGGGESPEESFAERNTVPELSGVAEDFDRLVDTLRQSAASLRRAAEDNAHAFKTPIAVIRQSVEPLRRSVAEEDTRCQRALTMIEKSLDKLDGLVSFARRMDEATADLLAPPRRRVNLSGLVDRMAGSYTGVLAQRSLHIRSDVEGRLTVRASEDILETVIENLVENAVSFSPPGGTVHVRLARRDGSAVLTVEDEGPGVDPANLPRIFERYFSQREPGRGMPEADPTGQTAEGTHFGIGLWIVRRNVEALGGRIQAENREGRGFRVRVALPLSQ